MTCVSKCSSAVLAVFLLGLLPAPAVYALDRQDEGHGSALVQTPESSDDLGRYLNRLAKNPRDVESLVGAGEAALKLGDARAAAEFFARADAVSPNNKRAKTGLARAMLGMENPNEALRLFRDAVRLGARDAEIAADRGLAFDLTGDTASAQRDYKLALDRDPDDPEVLRRYAVSLGIAGKWQEADRVIDPLLRKSDKTAWRNRAFILAMNGQSKQARDITQVMMPKNMANAIQPFMDRMPGLSPAQRAAAVHFGHFPYGIVHASQPAMVQPLPSAATSQPAAQPKDRATRREKPSAPVKSASSQVAAATPASRQAQSAAVPAPGRATQAMLPSMSPRQSPVPPAPVLAKPAPLPVPVPTAPMATTSVRASARAEYLIGPPSESDRAPPAAPSAAASLPPELDSRSLAEIMRGVSIPDTERQPATAAVDLAEVARLQAARRKAEQAAAAKAKAEADARAKAKVEAEAKAQAKAEAALKAKNPARIWVQIATGRDARALAFDMAKLRKKYPDQLKGKDAWTSPWGATRRMVIGPFASTSAAKSFYSDWMKAGGDGYIWQSTDGLEVEKLIEK